MRWLVLLSRQRQLDICFFNAASDRHETRIELLELEIRGFKHGARGRDFRRCGRLACCGLKDAALSILTIDLFLQRADRFHARIDCCDLRLGGVDRNL